MKAECFAPIARADACILILGSLPGAMSLAKQEYYAQPRNAFWKIIEKLFGIPANLPFKERAEGLMNNRVALWDVCASAAREGSLDSAIEAASVTANDFAAFFKRHKQITHVFFNGRKAEEIYRRKVLAFLPSTLHYATLPSTSPAHAGLSFEKKCLFWQEALNEFTL